MAIKGADMLGTRTSLEEFVKMIGILVILYSVCIAFPMLAKCDTVDELAYRYCNRPPALMNRISETEPITIHNCTKYMGKVYEVMRHGQYEYLQCVGVWTTTSGHAYVAYKDRFGDVKMLTFVPADKYGFELKPIVINCNDSIADEMQKNDKHRFIKYYEHNFGSNYTVEVL